MAMIFSVVVRFEVDADGQAYADFRRMVDALGGVDVRVKLTCVLRRIT